MREALRPALDRAARCDIAITLAENGLDVVVLGEVDRARLSALAALPGIARLSRGIDPEGEHELVALHRRPVIRFDGIAIEPPPHVFLQATIEGEQAIRDAMREGLDGARRVADLFSGCGTLSLPLARERQVMAIDSNAAALAALDAAARAGGLGARLRVLRRDLARRPLVGEELEDFDAVVFDPPREGARDQAAAIARSPVPRVVAVSCNPSTFARDAALLREGGYRLDRLSPVDQFRWSPHLELVGSFSRPRARRRGGAQPPQALRCASTSARAAPTSRVSSVDAATIENPSRSICAVVRLPQGTAPIGLPERRMPAMAFSTVARNLGSS
jgi:23S rRNA (uracil1939-C5)-methyltransferase